MRALQHVSRDSNTDPGDGTVVFPVVFGVVLVFVFVPLFFFMYRAWRFERAKGLGKQHAVATKEGDGRFDKAELSCGSSVVLREMDSPHLAQEMPETKEGLSHELPGALVLPQELPAELHEMPAENDAHTGDEAKKIDK
jgi:hypothetical protein